MEYEPRSYGTRRTRGINGTFFSWGPKLEFQLDLDWPIDPELEVIDLDSDDKAIRGLKDMIIVSDDYD